MRLAEAVKRMRILLVCMLSHNLDWAISIRVYVSPFCIIPTYAHMFPPRSTQQTTERTMIHVHVHIQYKEEFLSF